MDLEFLDHLSEGHSYVLSRAQLLEMGTLISPGSFPLPAGAVSHNLLLILMLCRVHTLSCMFLGLVGSRTRAAIRPRQEVDVDQITNLKNQHLSKPALRVPGSRCKVVCLSNELRRKLARPPSPKVVTGQSADHFLAL